MKAAHYPITHLPARALLRLLDHAGRIEMNLKQRFPVLLGLPVMGPYVQLYRHDMYFRTELSLFNYFSSFLPGVPMKLEYEVVAYRRNGTRIGSGRVTLEHGQSAQADLEKIIRKPLDDYGIFHVQAKPHPSSPVDASKLGTTTGQFMTLFCPTDAARQAPQLIHSHKLFQKMPIPYSPYTRKPHYTEDISAKTLTELFFLNPCPTSTRMVLHVFDAKTGEALLHIKRKIGGHGVESIVLKKTDLPAGHNVLTFSYEFKRRISHMKPIVFHHHADAVITCNHS